MGVPLKPSRARKIWRYPGSSVIFRALSNDCLVVDLLFGYGGVTTENTSGATCQNGTVGFGELWRLYGFVRFLPICLLVCIWGTNGRELALNLLAHTLWFGTGSDDLHSKSAS